MRSVQDRIRAFLSGSSPGTTLVEMIVSVGIITVTMGLIGGGLYQAAGTQRYWQKDVIATKEVRHAVSWFSRDAPNAKTTDLVDAAPPASSVTLSWIDKNDVAHSSSYSLVGGRVLRTYDGNQITVARLVTSAGFSRSGKVIAFTLTVAASRGGVETKDLKVYAQWLQ